MSKYSSILLITPILYLFYYNILIFNLLCGSICIFLFSEAFNSLMDIYFKKTKIRNTPFNELYFMLILVNLV